MLKATRSLLVALKSNRPLYCTWLLLLGLRTLVKNAISGVLVRLFAPPDPSPPVPGLLLLTNPASRVPRGAVSGEPRFRPCPAMKRQLTPSVRPMLAQV